MSYNNNILEENNVINYSNNKDILRFITCGSVDDGKSTLIGRMLFDSKMIFKDHLEALNSDSKKYGTVEQGSLDFALLVDGLESEREQGITIDVAYRYFSTDKRKFVAADTPGHEQYTRNMATGASNSDIAIILIDARKGVLTQTRRHSHIVSMMGIKHAILVVNKMDMTAYSEEIFNNIVEEYKAITQDFGFKSIQSIPVSALLGDNITNKSKKTKWYKGPTLLEYLETIEVSNHKDTGNLDACMPVQIVSRPNSDFRGYLGQVASGEFNIGDKIKTLPSRKTSKIKSIIRADHTKGRAKSGESITILLEDEIDISRGDIIVSEKNSFEIADQFEAKILWMSDKAMISSKQYIIQLATLEALATPSKIKHKIDINSSDKIVAKELNLNELGVCNLFIDRKIPFKPFAHNKTLGSFILIDRETNETVAAGTINHVLRRSSNIHTHNFDIDLKARALQKTQEPKVIWFTGLSGSGKSTIANALEKKLYNLGKHTMLLDGDNIRHGLNKDLSFSPQDRAENIRRVGEVAKLMMESGLIVISSFISPYKSERELVRSLVGADNFIEIFVDVPLETAEERDPKGLYKKARSGEIPNFTGVNAPYEAPETPNIHIHSDKEDVGSSVDKIINYLEF